MSRILIAKSISLIAVIGLGAAVWSTPGPGIAALSPAADRKVRDMVAALPMPAGSGLIAVYPPDIAPAAPAAAVAAVAAVAAGTILPGRSNEAAGEETTRSRFRAETRSKWRSVPRRSAQRATVPIVRILFRSTSFRRG